MGKHIVCGCIKTSTNSSCAIQNKGIEHFCDCIGMKDAATYIFIDLLIRKRNLYLQEIDEVLHNDPHAKWNKENSIDWKFNKLNAWKTHFIRFVVYNTRHWITIDKVNRTISLYARSLTVPDGWTGYIGKRSKFKHCSDKNGNLLSRVFPDLEKPCGE